MPVTVNATVPPFTVTEELVTVAVSVTVCAEGLKVAVAGEAVVVVVSDAEMTSDLVLSLLVLRLACRYRLPGLYKSPPLVPPE